MDRLLMIFIQQCQSDCLKATLVELFHNSSTRINIPVRSHSSDVSFPVGPFDWYNGMVYYDGVYIHTTTRYRLIYFGCDKASLIAKS